MKSTYKLIGLFWDNRPVPDEFPSIVDFVEVQDYREEYNLFDLTCYKRKIKLSEILSIEDKQNLNNIILSLKGCDEVYLHIDYIPNCESSVVCAFFIRRTMQIYRYIRDSVQYEVQVFVIADDAEKIRELTASSTIARVSRQPL